MRAIETEYNGVLFRSRLEAWWAVFFDALGIRWEYEPEGYELSDGTRYLPDFRVQTPDPREPDYGWIEIKSKENPDWTKADRLADDSGKQTLLLAGSPGDCSVFVCGHRPCGPMPLPEFFVACRFAPHAWDQDAAAYATARARAHRFWNPRGAR